MTYKEFTALKKDNWFHSKKRLESYKIIDVDSFNSRFWVEVYDSEWNLSSKTFWSWHNCENYDFEAGCRPHTHQPETQITCTVAEALEKHGLKVGDKFFVGIEVELTDIKGELNKNYPFCVRNSHLKFTVWLSNEDEITFTPQPDYNPAHDEICTVLTTTGFATKCKAYHHNSEIYAIALKEDKPDGTFSPEQISKFYKL